jgi:hypothetical protein
MGSSLTHILANAPLCIALLFTSPTRLIRRDQCG